MSLQELKRVVIKEELVALTGSYISALILNQFIYWSERTKDADKYIEEEKARNPDLDIEPTFGWVYKKANQLNEELMLDLSPTTIRRYIVKLVESSLLLERHNPGQKYDRTLQYRPDILEIQRQMHGLGYALEGYRLYASLGANLQNEGSNLQNAAWNSQNEGSNLQNAAWNSQNEGAIPEITTETTTEITTEIPPYTPPPPPRATRQQPGESKPAPVVEVFPLEESGLESGDKKMGQAQSSRTQVDPPKYPSAQPSENGNRYQRNQTQYAKNIDGSDRLPWEIPGKTYKFDPEFEKEMKRALIRTPYYEKLTAGELTVETRKHISRGKYDLKRRDELLIAWEGMHRLDNPSSNLTAKAAARRAKIARALNMELNP